jgi:hypothetical protein
MWLANSKRQPCFYPPYSHAQEDTQNWQKTDILDGKPVLCQRTFSSVFRAVFFIQSNCTECMGHFTLVTRDSWELSLIPRPVWTCNPRNKNLGGSHRRSRLFREQKLTPAGKRNTIPLLSSPQLDTIMATLTGLPLTFRHRSFTFRF